ncbi:MAG: helix-turn-helix transcriptional regulator [Leptolyngbyaceae cyanobacterium]
MVEPWVSERRTLQLPGITIDRHLSAPSALESPGCDGHLLCLLLSDGNQQKATRIGEAYSEASQAQGSFWICPAHTPGLWDWESTDESLMFVIEPAVLTQTAAAVSGAEAHKIELLGQLHANDSYITAIAHLFQSELDGSGMGDQLYAESLAQVFIVHLLRHYCAFSLEPQTQDGDIAPRRLQQVLDYIHSHLHQTLRLADLASVAEMSQYSFCRWFKQSMGIAPYQYVLQQRMEKAKALLLQNKYTIAEVALLVGCSDQSRFTKHFKKHVGVTPREFLSETLT